MKVVNSMEESVSMCRTIIFIQSMTVTLEPMILVSTFSLFSEERWKALESTKPLFSFFRFYSQTALARLPGPVPPSAFVRPALLPSDCGDNLANEIALVAGRGVISTDGSRDKRLRYATLKTLPRHVCYKTTNPISHPKSLICAVSIDDGKFAYNGDSGGPLIRQRDNALIGIASFVRKVDKAHIDGTDAKFVKSQAFQNVHFYFPWISRITGIKVPACPHPKPVTSKWGDVRLDRKRLEGFASLTTFDDFDSSDEESG